MNDFTLESRHDTTKFTAKTAILSTLRKAEITAEKLVGYDDRINVTMRNHQYQILIDEETTRIRIFLFLNRDPVFDSNRTYGIDCANTLNRECIYVKFWMDPDGTLNGEMDIPATTLSSGYIATRAIMNIDSGIDEIWQTILAYLQAERENR